MKFTNRRSVLAATTAALTAAVFTALLTPVTAGAQTWPAKPVSLIVCSAPGSAPDIYARILADQLTKQLGGTFLVDNKPGANGNLAAEFVARAPSDGYTMLIGTQSLITINPSAYPKLRWSPSDFKPIIKGVESPLVLVTNPSVPAKNFAQLRSWIAANKGKVGYASFSPGTPAHFLGFQLNEKLKSDMVHIPYKGSTPQVTDLVGGQVPLGFTQIALAVPQVQAGKLNAIAVTSAQRSPALPEVPTLAELGMKDMTTTVWFGVLISSATPKPLADTVLAAMQAAHQAPLLRGKLQAQNFDMGTESGAAFEQSIATESARWAGVVKVTGFRAND